MASEKKESREWPGPELAEIVHTGGSVSVIVLFWTLVSTPIWGWYYFMGVSGIFRTLLLYLLGIVGVIVLTSLLKLAFGGFDGD